MNKLKLLKAIFGKVNDDVRKCLPFVDEAISTLNERAQCVLQKRFSGMTLEETGKKIIRLDGSPSPKSGGISRTLVWKIQEKALRQLRHPSRMKILKGEWTAYQMLSSQWDPLGFVLTKEDDLNCIPIDKIRFSVRASSYFAKAGINTVGDLVQKTEAEILSAKNVGQKTLEEIKEVLNLMGLCLL
jgi:hypothetical protein